MKRATDTILTGLFYPAMLLSLWFAFFYAPEERVMGIVQRIFYFHVTSAWLSLLSFVFVFIGGVLYLWKRNPAHDRFAHAAAELGVVFCTIVLVSGPIWAKPVWNVWWTWDPRLTSTFILWLIYIAYLMLRSQLKDHPSIRVYASVYGIIGFVDVPIVWMSIRWWRTIHPKVLTPGKTNLDPAMWHAVIVCLLTLGILYTILLRKRMRIELADERVRSAQEQLLELQS